MSKVWIAVGAVTVIAAAAVGYVVVMRSRAPDLGPAGPNRELAPETLAVYVEAPNLRATWNKMKGTEAWIDLESSKVAAHLREMTPMKDLMAAIDEVSKKAAYPIDSDNAMKFIGRECSVGFALDPKGGAPEILVLTKLDVEALQKDLVNGKTDLKALWQELQRRTGQVDFVVTPEEYKGHTIAVAARGASKFHAALIGDTLAVATDGALVHGAIDCHLAKGERSLGRKPAFLADVKALPAGATAFEWFDLDALSANRASLDAGLAALDLPPEAPVAVHSVLDGIAASHSCARAEIVPEGDLYQATWTYSKTADLFADKASPAPRSLFSGEWIGYAETRDLAAVAAAWDKSALKRNVKANEIGKWLEKTMAEPSAQLKPLFDLFPRRRTKARPGAQRGPRTGNAAKPPTGADTAQDQPANVADEYLDEFSMRMGSHLVTEQLWSLVNGESAIGVGPSPKEGELPRMAGAIRLDVEGRLLMLAAQGVALSKKESGVTSEESGTRKVFRVDAGKAKVHWTLVGDTLLVSNDGDLVRQAAVSGDSKPIGPPAAIRDEVAAYKSGWCTFLYLDMEKLMAAVAGPAGEDRPAGAPPSPFDGVRAMGATGKTLSFATYVAADFSSIEMRSRTDMGDTKDSDLLGLVKRAESREPLCWATLPDTTFVHFVYPSIGVDMIWFMTKMVAGFVGGDINELKSAFREQMGMELETEFIPALGQEISVSIAYNAGPTPAPSEASGPPVIPGFLIGVEVKDAAKVRKAIDRVVEMVQGMMSDPSAPASDAPKLFVREPRDEVEILRLDLPPEAGAPVHPALALHAGYLLVASDVGALREAVDARNGKGKRLVDSASFVDATKVLGRKCASFGYVDWPRLLDQVAVYTPHLSGLFGGGGDDVKYPEFPEDGDDAEWRRRVAEYEKKKEASKAAGAPKIKAWIDSLRVIDYFGGSSVVKGNIAEGTTVVKFSK